MTHHAKYIAPSKIDIALANFFL
jgi:glycerol 2-dehydrogenase (NADP+)